MRFVAKTARPETCLSVASKIWQDITRAAEQAYDRTEACKFTSLVGYEWTAAPGANNLHRNVIFRNERVPDLPVSYFEAPSIEELWSKLDDDCTDGTDGCEYLSIPHNSNLSGGLMFKIDDVQALGKQGAELRRNREPLVEIIQHKGGSECLPGAGVEDELCAFEKLPYSNFLGKYVSLMSEAPSSMAFVRGALTHGLAIEEQVGANPFQFGFVGGTDTHLAAAGAADEDIFLGHGGAGTPASEDLPPGLPDVLEFNPGGLTGVWAEENTRDSIFSALKRRESFATSGPRITLRMFGGWDYPTPLCGSAGFVERGYRSGVPMGGQLQPRKESDRHHVPAIAVWAQRDTVRPEANRVRLQRIQIIKGWIDSSGAKREKVFDVAGDEAFGASIDPTTCEIARGGFNNLCTVWLDPEFDASRPAYYYARVLEQPTCRWSTLLCNKGGVDCEKPGTIRPGFESCCDENHRRIIQERAWSSPIWFTPDS